MTCFLTLAFENENGRRNKISYPHFLSVRSFSSGKAFTSFFQFGPELWGNGSSTRIARHNKGLPRWANSCCAKGSFSGSQNGAFCLPLASRVKRFGCCQLLCVFCVTRLRPWIPPRVMPQRHQMIAMMGRKKRRRTEEHLCTTQCRTTHWHAR